MRGKPYCYYRQLERNHVLTLKYGTVTGVLTCFENVKISVKKMTTFSKIMFFLLVVCGI